MSDAPLHALLRALDARRGDPVRFWLRDDDAVAATPQLERLLALAAQVPLTLAVIPAFAGADLAERLREQGAVAVAVHGWAHRNHAGAGEKSQELGPHRAAQAVLGELAAGFARLSRDYPAQFVPMLVPPWNRISPLLVPALPDLGFRALSTFGPARAGPLAQINTHVDLMDWRGSRGGRALAVLVPEILTALQAGEPAIGVLSHHLVHDAVAWEALEQLVAATAGHPGCVWMPVSALMDAALP